MSTRLSEEITQCIRSGRDVLSAFEVEGPSVAEHFLDFTGHTGDDTSDDTGGPNPIGFLVAIESKMRGSLEHLTETDHAVARAMGLESLLRQEYRTDKQQLALLIVALRRMVLAQYTRPDMDNLGLQPVNVRDGITIARRAGLVGERFEAVNLAQMLGKSRFEGPIDLSPYVAEIRAKAALLLGLSDAISEAHRGTDRARIERKRARVEYDRVFLRGTRMFEDMCRFVGLDDLADRIRKPKRRAKASEEDRRNDEDSRDDETIQRGVDTVVTVVDGNVLDPNVLDPNVLDPNVLDPNVLDPNVLDPKVSTPPRRARSVLRPPAGHPYVRPAVLE